jgi:hypothetical protein
VTEDLSARRFAIWAALIAALISVVPFLVANFLFKPAGGLYLGSQTANDDLMVYSAWMFQAAEGKFLFDNRFAVDPQPGLTIHLYFLVLGWISKLAGILEALTLARMLGNAALVWAIYQFVRRVTADGYAQKVAIVLSVLGGGLGFLAWQNFGIAGPSPFSALISGRLPTDVWQPEGFVFPSMLVNGLFSWSLVLILSIFSLVLDARESAKPVWKGALCFLLLMNIHSYDVVIVTATLVGLLGMSLLRKQADPKWIGRVGFMGLGALPAAFWFIHVLSQDAVFQARAATPTYSPLFRQVFFGYLPLIALGLLGISMAFKNRLGETEHEVQEDRFGKLKPLVVGLFVLGLFLMSGSHADTNQYWMTMGPFIVALAVGLAVVVFTAGDSPGLNLLASWAILGLIIPYFPALFQRKLLMGLALPWAMLGAIGFAVFFATRERGQRNLACVLVAALVAGSSVQWLQREISLARANVSSTTTHAVFYGPDVPKILEKLRAEPGRKVLIAMPGIATPGATPGNFQEPYLPDLNPVVSGLAGAYSYAGHWSETPNYNQRRGEATSLFLASTSPEKRAEILKNSGATHLIAPMPEAFANFSELTGGRDALVDPHVLGEEILEGNRFCLIRIK